MCRHLGGHPVYLLSGIVLSAEHTVVNKTNSQSSWSTKSKQQKKYLQIVMSTGCSDKEQGLSEESVFKLKDDQCGACQVGGTVRSTLY